MLVEVEMCKNCRHDIVLWDTIGSPKKSWYHFVKVWNPNHYRNVCSCDCKKPAPPRNQAERWGGTPKNP